MIAVLFILYLVLVYGAKSPNQSNNSKLWLEDFEHQVLSTHKNRDRDGITIDIKPILKIPPKKLLADMESMDDCAFILLWSSYGSVFGVSSRATGCLFIKELPRGKRPYLNDTFYSMKNNYIIYLKEVLFKEFLRPDAEISKQEKEELLFLARNLYRGKFQSIWMRIVTPKSEYFDNLKDTFTFYQRVITLGAYGFLEYIFNEIWVFLDNLKKDQMVIEYRKQFHRVAVLLSKNESENWGLRWIDTHNNPYLILSYFMYQSAPPDPYFSFVKKIRRDKEYRKVIFQKVLEIMREKFDDKFSLRDEKVIFDRDFKCPFAPKIMKEDELKRILSSIVSKLHKFCHPCKKGPPRHPLLADLFRF
jgi:hypothetical protein